MNRSFWLLFVFACGSSSSTRRSVHYPFWTPLLSITATLLCSPWMQWVLFLNCRNHSSVKERLEQVKFLQLYLQEVKSSRSQQDIPSLSIPEEDVELKLRPALPHPMGWWWPQECSFILICPRAMSSMRAATSSKEGLAQAWILQHADVGTHYQGGRKAACGIYYSYGSRWRWLWNNGHTAATCTTTCRKNMTRVPQKPWGFDITGKTIPRAAYPWPLCSVTSA